MSDAAVLTQYSTTGLAALWSHTLCSFRKRWVLLSSAAVDHCECLRHNVLLCSSALGSVHTVFTVSQLRFGVRVFPQSFLADSAGTAGTVCQEPLSLTAYNINAYSMPCRLGWHRWNGLRCAGRRARGIGCTMRKACIDAIGHSVCCNTEQHVATQCIVSCNTVH